MDVVPDTKSWTWVLERRCPECGLDTREVPPERVAGMLRECAAAWAEVLRVPAAARERPQPGVWSPLEYACHVRDVFRVFDERLRLMLEQDDPLFPNWDQDATAVQERYGEQDPADVTLQLLAAGETLAAHLDGVRGEAWQRPGRRSDGARFTVATFARYLLHDAAHHVWDVTGCRFGAGDGDHPRPHRLVEPIRAADGAVGAGGDRG